MKDVRTPSIRQGHEERRPRSFIASVVTPRRVYGAGCLAETRTTSHDLDGINVRHRDLVAVIASLESVVGVAKIASTKPGAIQVRAGLDIETFRFSKDAYRRSRPAGVWPSPRSHHLYAFMTSDLCISTQSNTGPVR